MSWYERFNVFGDVAPATRYHDAPAHVHVVHRSPDGRHLTLYSDHPEGVTFSQPPSGIGETFYVVEGTITATAPGDEPVVFRAGDVVHWSYDRPLELDYSADLRAVCFFWSDDGPLPDFANGADVV